MPKIELKNIRKEYEDGYIAVKDFNLEIEDGEFTVLVGPSGCGKSTTLRMIAGLESITSGELYINSALQNNIKPKDRDLAMVFQSYALYPHMTVFDNMAFSLQVKKISKAEIKKRVNEAAEMLDLVAHLEKKPGDLSGGQRQRVALGRAIVRDTGLFLMDEPLSNLDAKLRVQTRSEIIDLHKKLKNNIIYVTHDQTEALTMGDRIVILNDGIVQQQDTPENVYNHPSNMFVASFIGSPQITFFEASMTEDSENYVAVVAQKEGIAFSINFDKNTFSELKEAVGQKIILGARPEDMEITALDEGDFDMDVTLVEQLGSEQFLYNTLVDRNICIRCEKHIKITIGDRVGVQINRQKIHVFNKETEVAYF